MNLENIMDSYKPLIAIPIIITLLSLALIGFNGLHPGIDLKGGTITTLTLEKQVDQNQLSDLIKGGLNTSEVTVNSFDGKTATVTIGTATDVITFTKLMNGTASITSYRSIGPVLSAQALNQVYWALAIAFIFMSIT
ncbi:MAG: protein translocase subunit SecF, partial [Methanobacterium sp.]